MNQDKSLTTQLQPLSGQRQRGESDAAVQACNDYLRMGAGRKLVDLLNTYQQLSTFSSSYEAPTLSDATVRTWSSKYSWANRATEYDSEWEDRKNAERSQVFDMALALDYGRVRKLINLANLLESQIYEYGVDDDGKPTTLHNVWLPDVKQVGSGEFAERVDIERFNSALISEYRSTLDDIAKEVGGRVKKNEHTGADGGDLVFKLIYPDGD